MALIPPFKNKEIADRVLEDWDDACNEVNIPHFLILGTCLGFYRDKGYIESDSDLDVGVLCDHQRLALLTKALRKRGIEDKGSLAININFGRDSILLDVWYKFGPLHHKYLDKLDTVIYEGREYNTPGPVEDYLEFTYNSWKTPIAYNAKAEDGSWLGKAKRSACDYTNRGPILL